MGTVGKLTNDGSLIIKGEINERLPVVTDGLVAHFPFDGVAESQYSKRSLLDTSQWVVGRKGAQGNFALNGTSAENDVIIYKNPWGYEEVTWASLQNDAASDADGGWNVSNIPIDKTKKYRLSVWIKKEDFGNGSTYLGCQQSTVTNLGTATVNGNPYFTSGTYTEIRDSWVLFVGYIHPHDYTGVFDPTNGMYYKDGTKIRNIADFKWIPTATLGGHRSYQYYSTKVDEKQYWVRPRFEVCDGSESTIKDLLNDRDDVVYPNFNSNTTLSSDGIAVEIASQNHILSEYNGENDIHNVWGRDTVGVSFSNIKDSRIAKFSSYVTKLTKDTKVGSSNCYINTPDKFSSKESNVWTFSCYVRRADNKPVTSVGSVYMYCTGLASWFQAPDYIEDCGDGWYRVVKTRSGIDIPRKVNLVGFNSIDTTTDWYFDGWQLEALPYATSYIDGSRNIGRIDIPFDLKPPYTINLWHKASKPLSEITVQDTSPMIFQMNTYHSNASISFWNYSKTLRVYFKGNIGSGWSSNKAYKSFTAAEWENKEHMYTLVAVDNRTFKVYMDGVYLGEQTNDVDVTNISYLTLGDVNQPSYHPNARYRNLSIYNKDISNKDIENMYKDSFSINKDGNLKSKSIIEKTNHIPNDAIHIPLDFNSKDRLSLVSSSSEANTVYEKGAVWVGTATTNLITYPNFSNGVSEEYAVFSDKIVQSELSSPTNTCLYIKYINEGEINASSGIRLDNTVGIGEYTMSLIAKGTGNSIGKKLRVYTGENWYTFNSFLESEYKQFTLTCLWGTGSGGALRLQISGASNNDELWIHSPQIEQKSFSTPYTNSIRPLGELEFNLNRDYKLDWSKDWSIVYWKKPIGTMADTLTNYNIESLGVSGNTIGGGYEWFGKDASKNNFKLNASALVSPVFNPNSYFGKWQMVSLVKSGNKITYKNHSRELGVFESSFERVITLANYYVNQFGHDLKLSGYSNANPMNTWFKDLIVAKRAFSNQELEKMFKTNMSNNKKGLTINNQVIENQNLI